MCRAAPKPRSRLRRNVRLLVWLVLLVIVASVGYLLYFRYVQGSFYAVVEGEVYRSAQPTPDDLGQWVPKHGLKTVINLRGKSDKAFYEQERDALDAAGVKLVDIRLTADHMPAVGPLKRLIEAIETAPRPVLLHCRDGIDRSGVAGVIAAMAVGGESYASALGQLSVRKFHWGTSRSGIREMLSEYEAFCERQGLATAGWEQFKHWAATQYHPYYYFIEISAPDHLEAKVGGTIAIPVKITNRSLRTIPAGDADKRFRITTFWGTRTGEWPDPRAWAGTNTYLPKQDIEPGQAIDVAHSIQAPARAGKYVFHLDVFADDDRKTLFGVQGSPVETCEVVVGGDETPRQVPLRKQ